MSGENEKLVNDVQKDASSAEEFETERTVGKKKKRKDKASKQPLKEVKGKMQGNLNGFVQIKSPTKEASPKETVAVVDEDDCKESFGVLRISSELFSSPRRTLEKKRKKAKIKKKVLNLKPTEENEETNEFEITVVIDKESKSKSEKVDETCNFPIVETVTNDNLEKKIPVSEKVKINELNNENLIESSKTEDVTKRTNGKIKKPKKSKKQKSINCNKDSKPVIVVEDTIDNSIVTVEEYTSDVPRTSISNVFQFMMDQRNKSIGSNSPGKVLDVEEEDPTVKEKKQTLLARKQKLEEWNEARGGKKRKHEEDEKDECIEIKMERRKKRLTKLVTKNMGKRRRVIVSDSESSNDAVEVMENGLLDSHGQCQEKEVVQENIVQNKTTNKKSKSNKKVNNKTCVVEVSTDNNSREAVIPKRTINESVIDAEVVDEGIEEVLDVENEQPRKSRRSRAVVNYAELADDSSGKIKTADKKVAPVFLKSAPRPKVDPAVLQRRLEFLHSGVPNCMKRVMEKQMSPEEIYFDVFPTVSHVQQKSQSSLFWELPRPGLNLKDFSNERLTSPPILTSGCLTTVDNSISIIDLKAPKKLTKFSTALKEIKHSNPNFPVYKTFHTLYNKSGLNLAPKTPRSEKKKKRGRPKKKSSADDDVQVVEPEPNNLPQQAMWTEKYKPHSSEDIIGNEAGVRKLKDWLGKWLEYSEEMQTIRKKKRARSTDSSDFESTDGDSRDLRLPTNAMIVTGPSGCGKSVAVYAVCQELGINVIELNASSRRTGKKLMQELQEATQSHQVRKNSTNPLSSFFSKQNEPKEDQTKNKMCLLLVEEVDIVFEQDEGFITSLVQLLGSSKRPVLMLSSDETCPHVQRFISQFVHLKFEPLTGQTLSSWLQVVCLLEGLNVDRHSVAELLDSNNGDVRKTLLQLQFWTSSGGDSYSETVKSLYKLETELSFDAVCTDAPELPDDTDSDLPPLHSKCVFVGPINPSIIWWNLPSLLKYNDIVEKEKIVQKLESVYNALETLAYCDTIYRSESVNVPSETYELRDSVALKENFCDFRSNRTIQLELADFLVERNCCLQSLVLVNSALPSLKRKRWKENLLNCNRSYSDAISQSYYTDRSALSLDYFPALRQISRIETNREATNNKRGNRFYSYLRTLNINPSKLSVKTACRTFTSRKID